jgi:hypothetical protein
MTSPEIILKCLAYLIRKSGIYPGIRLALKVNQPNEDKEGEINDL